MSHFHIAEPIQTVAQGNDIIEMEPGAYESELENNVNALTYIFGAQRSTRQTTGEPLKTLGLEHVYIILEPQFPRQDVPST